MIDARQKGFVDAHRKTNKVIICSQRIWDSIHDKDDNLIPLISYKFKDDKLTDNILSHLILIMKSPTKAKVPIVTSH